MQTWPADRRRDAPGLGTPSADPRSHFLRHTAACVWLARGVDPATVQKWCGHESIATTKRYCRRRNSSDAGPAADHRRRQRDRCAAPAA
ncbi:tyrosine-type recombinase/integrase [Kribbella endophytica]